MTSGGAAGAAILSKGVTRYGGKTGGFLLVSTMVLMFITGFAVGAETDESPSESDMPHYEVPPVEVRGTPIVEGNYLSPYAGQIAVVGSEQIEALNAQDLTSALRRAPGVVISRFNHVGSFGGGTGGSVYIRGHGSGRPGAEIVTLFDGVPRSAGIWSHPLLDTAPIETSRRVEIMKSAQPVLIGNMAFGAVNMLPKRIRHEGFGTRIRS